MRSITVLCTTCSILLASQAMGSEGSTGSDREIVPSKFQGENKSQPDPKDISPRGTPFGDDVVFIEPTGINTPSRDADPTYFGDGSGEDAGTAGASGTDSGDGSGRGDPAGATPPGIDSVDDGGPTQSPPCEGDTNDDGMVDVTDLVNVLLCWTDGPTREPCLQEADIDGSGSVNVKDLLRVILGWGACP